MVQGSNLGRRKIFFLFQKVQTGSVAHPTYYSNSKLPGVKLTTNLHPVLKLMSGPIPPPPLHISMVQTGKSLPLLLLSLMGFKAQLHHPYKFNVFLLPHWV
jgi:hypothetical protein